MMKKGKKHKQVREKNKSIANAISIHEQSSYFSSSRINNSINKRKKINVNIDFREQYEAVMMSLCILGMENERICS